MPACVPALPVAVTIWFLALLQEFFRAADVAERADRVRGAARDDVRLAAVRGNLVGHVSQRLVEVRPAGILAKVGRKHSIEEHVT